MELLLDKGVYINQVDTLWDKNALHLAARNGHIDVVKILIEQGVDMNEQDKDRRNALHLAAHNGHRAVVKLLIKNGCSLDRQDKDLKLVIMQLLKY